MINSLKYIKLLLLGTLFIGVSYSQNVTYYDQSKLLSIISGKDILVDEVIKNSLKYHLQINFTRIDEKGENIKFEDYSLNKDKYYFHPASLIKLPLAIASLELLTKYQNQFNIGLNNILVGNEKFANTTTKVSLLGQKLIQARQAFITDFLLPEIKRISKEIGFKVFPTPFFEDMDLKTDQNLNRIYTRLMELGVLTPEEGLKAIETGVLPSPEESLQSQNSFIDLKDKGLYQPLIGGPKIDAGRPAGSTGIKQTTKNVKPVGTSSKANYSVTKLKDIVEATNKLGVEVENILKKKHKLKKLNDKQKEVALDITKIIVANEEKSNWTSKISEYIDSPVDKNEKTVEEIHGIACEHQVDSYMASLLYHSKI